MFRAYHSMPPLTRADGTPTGAVYGFCNMLTKLLGDHEGDYIAVALDAGKKTFRNELYSDYKANRPPPPEDLIPQFPLVQEAVDAFNLKVLRKEGYEADDLIATYTKLAKEKGLDVLVVSSDKDLMQLVDAQVTMFDPLKSRFIKHEQVIEKFGVEPKLVLDVLALMGDSSDNIPGVPGIGPKIAAELINQFGGLDALLESTDQIKQAKRRENLETFKEQALLSRELARLAFDAPQEHPLDALEFEKANTEQLAAFFKHQGFKSLLARLEVGASFELSSTGAAIKSSTPHQFTTIETAKQLKQQLSNAGEISTISLFTDVNKANEVIGFSLSLNQGNHSYITITQASDDASSIPAGDLFSPPQEQENSAGVTIKELVSILKPYLERKDTMLLGFDIKPLLQLLLHHSCIPAYCEDVMVMSYVLHGTSQKLEMQHLALEFLGMEIAKIDAKLEGEERQKALTLISSAIARLAQQFKLEIAKEKLLSLYARIENPLVQVLSAMEYKGIKLDRLALKSMSDAFAKQLEQLEKEIHHKAGSEFNIGSPKQLGEILFEKMSIEGGKKSKSGAYGTDASVLETIAANGHSIADDILNWRQISKLKSTYTDALPKQIKDDGRVHTHYGMASTSTGRLSSNDPNLQNIPTRTEAGNKIRETFIAEKGKKLISADYSQIELRLLAHMADIDTLKEAFKHGQDIHAATASQVFNMPLDKVTSEVRRRAKAINFGIIYGMSAFGLANRLRISRGDAKQYIENYFKQYPGIRKYMDKTIEFAKEHGFVLTLFGRKCFIRDIQGKNPAMRQFAERAAINAPLQGTAADIIKKAMVALHQHILSGKLKAEMLLQVHDELIFEVDEANAEYAATIIKNVMENVLDLSVPLLTVEVGIGHNWAEIHG